jgi:bifunctional non-homologous end joining protein LigD
MGEAPVSAARVRRRSPGGPPLPLSLPPVQTLPQGLRPELAVPCSAAFDAPGWRFSIDWDGMRCLLLSDGAGGLRIQDERMRDVTPLFPDLAEPCAAALAGRRAVIDGVIAVLDREGRPDLRTLAVRVCLPLRTARRAAAVFIATDLLHFEGTALLSRPLTFRRQTLSQLAGAETRLQVPDDIAEEGIALADAAAERGLVAIVARRGDAPYRPGVASTDRLRISLEDRVDVVATAVLGPVLQPAGMLIAEYVEGRLVHAGRIEAAWPAEQQEWMSRVVAGLRGSEPAIEAAPPPGPVTWLRPGLTVTIRHGGRAPDGTFRFPVAVALREDRDPAWCIRRDPLPPPGESRPSRGFRPTVLQSLPLEVPSPPS